MISKFPAVGLHIQAERRSRVENAVSLSTHRRAKEGLDLESSVSGYERSRSQRREKGANDSRPTWLELRKFRSTAAAPSRKSKYRLRTRKSIPARNIYRQRVTLVTRSFRRNNEVFPGKNWVARVRVPFLSIPLSIDTFYLIASMRSHYPRTWIRVGERNIPHASKQILQFTGVDLTPRERASIRQSIFGGWLHAPLSVWMNVAAADCVTRKIFITLIKIYHNACI